jgi:hypothetical protein
LWQQKGTKIHVFRPYFLPEGLAWTNSVLVTAVHSKGNNMGTDRKKESKGVLVSHPAFMPMQINHWTILQSWTAKTGRLSDSSSCMNI